MLIATVVPGSARAGDIGDGGLARDAVLSAPSDVAVDGNGNVYVADRGHHRVRRIDAATGTITNVAGNGSPDVGGDGGPAIEAGVPVLGIALDSSGALYVAGGRRVRRVDPKSGVISTIAGGGTFSADHGDGGPAVGAWVAARDVAIDPTGAVFVTDGSIPVDNCSGEDCWDSRVRRIDPLTGTISTVHRALTNATYLSAGTGGRLLVTNDSYADCCTSTYLDASIPGGGAWYRVTARGCPACIEQPPDGLPAMLWWPYHDTFTGNATDATGTIFVGHGSDGRASGGLPTTIVRLAGGQSFARIAGTLETPGCTGDGGPATDALLGSVAGLATDALGTLYVADAGADRIRTIAPDGTIDTIAGAACP